VLISTVAKAVKQALCVTATLIVMCGGLEWPLTAQSSERPAVPIAMAAKVDHQAVDALVSMGAYLRSLKTFRVLLFTSRAGVVEDGQRIQLDGTVDLLVQAPDRLRAEVSKDRHRRMYFYDGKRFSVWSQHINYYYTLPAPPALFDVVRLLDDSDDLELSLVDLFYWGTEQSKVSRIKAAIDVGSAAVDGVTCEHYVFRQDGLDWQIWIQKGADPLPRKLTLTTTDRLRPRYASVLSWNLAPSFNDATFTFSPPPDSREIVLTELPGITDKR
jgi:hypothetical protein